MIIGLVLAGSGIFVSQRGESAPAPREEVVEVPIAGTTGGITAEVPSDIRGVVVATFGPDGKLEIHCTDPGTAAQLVAGATP